VVKARSTAAPAITVQPTDESEPTRHTSASTHSFSGDTTPAAGHDTAVPLEEPAPTVQAPRVPRTAARKSHAVGSTAAAPKAAPAATKPSADPAAVPKPAPTPQPAPTPASTPLPPSGSWADLPLGDELGDDITDLAEEPDDLDDLRPKPAWLQLIDMIRGDAWAMFMAGAAVIAIVLLIILFLLK
jgi:hypothetical protein